MEMKDYFATIKKKANPVSPTTWGKKISHHNVIIPGLPQIIESEEETGIFLDETWAPKPVVVIRVNSR